MSPVAVAQLSELSEEPLSVEVPGYDIDVAMVRIGDDVFAIKDECSHGHVALSEGDVDEWDCTIECYLHGAQFSLKTGEPLNLPATTPVPVYPCSIQDGTVLVDIDNPITNQENN